MNNKKAKFGLILAGVVFLMLILLFFGHEKLEYGGEEIVRNENFPKVETAQERSSPEEASEEEASQEETEMNEEDLQQYYAAYSDPHVLHVRKALDGYLAGTNEGMEMPDVVIEKSEKDGKFSGLSAFDKSYYKSKFVVVWIDNSAMGGKAVSVLFQEKPDKVFTAWVYKLAGDGDEYDLRGFWEEVEMTENLDSFLEKFGDLAFDQQYCL